MTSASPWIILRLARANMTVISAVTYLAGAVLGARGFVLPAPYFAGWLFVVLTQFMTHFLGEVADFRSDALNRYSTPITGGSKVLHKNLATKHLANFLGYFCLFLAAIVLKFIVPARAQPVGVVIMLLAWAYSAEPVKLNHRCLGEIDAALVTNVLLPYFAAAVQNGVSGAFPWYDRRLSILVVPPVLVKVSLFLLLNLADRRPDWAAGKITLAVYLGDYVSARLHAALMLSAYLVATFIAIMDRTPAVLLFVMPSLPYGARISRVLLRKVPYRMNTLLGPGLLHSTLLVWGVLIHTLWFAPAKGFRFYHLIAIAFAWISFDNVRKGRKRAAELKAAQEAARAKTSSDSVAISFYGQPGVKSALLGNKSKMNGPATSNDTGENTDSSSDSLSDTYEESPALRNRGGTGGKHRVTVEKSMLTMAGKEGLHASADVVVVGAGVAGLVSAAALTRMGLDVLVLERRESRHSAETGADLALWPGAIAILKELGVPASFFETFCFPLRKVHMCNMDFPDAVTDNVSATILKTINMEAVTEETGEQFVLVPRMELMDALRQLVDESLIVYGATVVHVSECEETESVTVEYEKQTPDSESMTRISIHSRIALGCDGARSVMRKHVHPDLGDDAIRFCGEVCYRGVLRFRDADDNEMERRVRNLFPDEPESHTMRINYGAGLRSSFGYMSADGGVAYWWVKQSMSAMPDRRGKMGKCPWPEPLRTLHDATAEDAFYMHAIEDSAGLSRWSSNRVALVGDSAHVVTPNMGQGACLAVEDAFVLTSLICKFWAEPDGHVEAFYRFERCRKPFAEGVAAESRKQLFLGQLSSWIMVKLRESLLWIMPQSVLERKLKANNFAVGEYVTMYRDIAGLN